MEEKKEENPQVNQVSYYFETSKGGLVIIYKITNLSELVDEIFIVTFDDTYDEQPWGIGLTLEDALEHAAQEWNMKSNTEEEHNDNPFREILARLKK
jgi:hypothetical protein